MGSWEKTAAARELPARYADVLNRRAPERLGEIFAAGSRWIVPGLSQIDGVDAAIEALQSILAGYPHLLQMVGATVLDEHPDGYRGRTVFSEWGRDNDGHNIHMTGLYTDVMVQTGAGWRFSERRLEFFYRGRTPAAGKFYALEG